MYILYSPSVRNPLSYLEKRLWDKDYLGIEVANKLILFTNMGLLKGNNLIDDWINGQGQQYFEGEIIHFGSIKCPTWNDVVKKLIKMNSL